MIIVIVGIIATLVGLFGYSLIPEKRVDQNEKYLSSIINFYMVVCFTLFIHMYSYFFQMRYMFVELFFGFSMTGAAIYLLWTVIGFNKNIGRHFDFFKLRNGVLYASIAWLMGKELASLEPQPFVLPGLILLPSFFVLLVMKESKLFFFYENSSVFSNSFLTVLLSGIAIISMTQAPNAQLPIESIAAVMALYVVLRMFRAAKPFLG
jgi:hypothetical protein